MAFFYSFTDSLKQKWLEFFQANHDWISLHMQVESVYTPDGGKRPPSYLILGVVNALEPKLAQLMLPFSKLNPDADTLIEVLDLHFDPDLALGNRIIPSQEPEEILDESVSVAEENSHFDETLTIPQTSESADNPVSHEETLMVPEAFVPRAIAESLLETHNEFADISLSNGHNGFGEQPHQSNTLAADEFGEISFNQSQDTDSVATLLQDNLDDEMLSGLNQEESVFSDVLTDVWGEEKAAHKGEVDNEFLLGEDLPSGVFDDSEIARLFPNA